MKDMGARNSYENFKFTSTYTYMKIKKEKTRENKTSGLDYFSDERSG